MTNFVFIVSKQTLNDLLVSWLRLSDVGKLDAALCDRACRDVFEHSLALRNFRHAGDMHCASLEFISWVIKRKIKLDALLIGSNLLRRKNEKLRLQLLEIVGPTLRSAVINAGDGVALNNAYFTKSLAYESDSSSESDSDSSSNSLIAAPIAVLKVILTATQAAEMDTVMLLHKTIIMLPKRR